MQMCLDHWIMLRKAINDLGLSNLVASNGDQIARNFASELEHGITIDNFDPLMYAHNAIILNALEALGTVFIKQGNCPICSFNKSHTQTCKDPNCIYKDGSDIWIEYASNEALEKWNELKP